MSLPPIVDSEAIENLRSLSPDDGDVFLKEILTIFVDDTPQRVAELRSTLSAGDVTSFIRAAHSIKGSSSNVGAARLRILAEELEHQAKKTGLTDVAAQVSAVELAFSEAKTEFEKLIAG